MTFAMIAALGILTMCICMRNYVDETTSCFPFLSFQDPIIPERNRPVNSWWQDTWWPRSCLDTTRRRASAEKRGHGAFFWEKHLAEKDHTMKIMHSQFQHQLVAQKQAVLEIPMCYLLRSPVSILIGSISLDWLIE